jgi:hypothetical protein
LLEQDGGLKVHSFLRDFIGNNIAFVVMHE